jgi:hypothetical protein
VPEWGSLGSVRGALSNGRSYRELIEFASRKRGFLREMVEAETSA